jgi:general secretion pathway protein M
MRDRFLKYKDKWDALAKREQYALAVGTVCVILFILYELIWSPYLTAVNNLRDRIVSSQKTLVWMQAADQTLQQMESHHQKGQVTSPVVLLSVLQKELNTAGLSGELTSLKQSAADAIQLSFQKVDFDKLLALLIKTVKEQNVYIAQMSVTSDSTPGLVTVEIVLKLGA